MNYKNKQLFVGCFGILIFLVVIYVCYLLLNYFAHLLLTIDKQVAAAIIATSGTILAAVSVALYSQRRTKDREIAESHRPQKIELYKQFMNTISEVLKNSKNKNENQSPEEFAEKYEEFFIRFTSDLIVWGSPGVIKAYENFRLGAANDSNILLLVEDLLREIRKDLGNSTWNLKRGDLLKLYLKDPDELDKMLLNK